RRVLFRSFMEEDGSGTRLGRLARTSRRQSDERWGTFHRTGVESVLRLAGFPDDQISSLAQVANHVVQVIVCHVLGNAHGVINVYFKLLQTPRTRRGRRGLGAGKLARLAATFALAQCAPLVALEVGQVCRDLLLVSYLTRVGFEEFSQHEVIAS